MRGIHIGISWFSLLAMTSSLSAHANELASSPNTTTNKKTHALHYTTSSNHAFYLQAASFKVSSNAIKYKHHLEKTIPYPVVIKKHGHFDVIIIGPIKNAADMDELAKKLSNKTLQTSRKIHQKPITTTQDTPVTNEETSSALTYSSKMGPVMTKHTFQPFVSGEGLFSWPQVKGYTIILPPSSSPNIGTSNIINHGWGGRVAAGLMHATTERFAYSGEIGLGYYGHTVMPVQFTHPLSEKAIAGGIGNISGNLDRWGFDTLVGLLYTQPKYDVYIKAGALFENLRLSLSDITMNQSAGTLSTNSILPAVLPEIKLGAAYHITEQLAANLSWMYAFGGPLAVTLPYNDNNSEIAIGAIGTELKNPSMNAVMFGLEYRFG